MSNVILKKPADARVPIDKEKVLKMFEQLPQMAQIGIVSSLSVLTAAMPDAANAKNN